jgi:hypothetical protein
LGSTFILVFLLTYSLAFFDSAASASKVCASSVLGLIGFSIDTLLLRLTFSFLLPCLVGGLSEFPYELPSSLN